MRLRMCVMGPGVTGRVAVRRNPQRLHIAPTSATPEVLPPGCTALGRVRLVKSNDPGELRPTAASASRVGRAEPGGAGRAAPTCPRRPSVRWSEASGDGRTRTRCSSLAGALDLDTEDAPERLADRAAARASMSRRTAPTALDLLPDPARADARSGEPELAQVMQLCWSRPDDPHRDADRPGRRRQDPPGAGGGPACSKRIVARSSSSSWRRCARWISSCRRSHGRFGSAGRLRRPDRERWPLGLLAGRAPILVLDNVEHLMAAAPEIAELVQPLPEAVLLATSRAPLRIRAEQEVSARSAVGADVGGDAASVAASAAGRVFADRARSVVPRLRRRPIERRSGGRHLPSAGRTPAGAGARGRPPAVPRTVTAARPPGPRRRLGPAAGPAGTAADHAGDLRLEPRPADRR